MRKQIMDGLRKAGQRLSDFDNAYADKLAAALTGDPEKVGFLRSTLAGIAGSTPRNTKADIDFDSAEFKALPSHYQFFSKNIEWGGPAAGYGIRYGLPAVGVTLAGKGLYDLSQGLYAMAADTPVFGGPEDGAQPGQLPLQ